jgi:hypothetical protein
MITGSVNYYDYSSVEGKMLDRDFVETHYN